MKPVMQTKLGRTGNCFSACLASMFELSIDDVPNFYEAGGEDPALWWGAVRDWLRPRGFGIMTLGLASESLLGEFAGWFIVSGKSCRNVDHATIWRDGKLVHDPHPSKCGIVEATCIDLLYPLDPATLQHRG